MFLLCLTLVTISLVLWFWMKWSRVKKYWAERNVPFEPPHPVLGNLTFLQRDNPATWMRRLYSSFKSPYVGVWLFWRPALVINSPEIAKRVLVKDFDVFRDRFLSSGKSDPIGSLNIFTVNDPTWTAIRRRMTLVFTAAKLRAMEALVIKKSDDLIERIARDRVKTEPLHIREIFTDYTSDVIGESSFGVSSECTRNGDSVIRRITKEFGTFSFHRGLSWSSIFFCPDLVDYFRFTFFPKNSTDSLAMVFKAVVEQRGGYGRQIKEPKDLFDALLKLKYEAAQENEEMSEDLVLAQAAIFLFGGFETSGSIFSFLTYEMAYAPSFQDKLYNELVEAKQRLFAKEFDSKLLAELPYLNAVIKETLRKYPPMGWLDRIAAKDYKIDENLTIKAGTVVYVNAVGMQVDPELFPEPYAFDPDRFLPENEKEILPYSYLPFGEGPRNCIGMRFAHQVLRFGIAKLFLSFRVEPLPGAPKPHQVQIQKTGLLLMPGEKLSVNFVPREKLSF